MKTQRSNKIFFSFLILATAAGLSCKKMIEVDLPVNKITGQSVYSNTNTAVAAMNAVYADLARSSLAQRTALKLGFAADELIYTFSFAEENISVYRNDFANPNSDLFQLWSRFYRVDIYQLNSVIEGVSASKSIPENIKRTIIAEARFTRALLYFNLVNLYGEVPLVLTTDFKINSNIARSSVAEVYDQIINDLNEAAAGLPSSYLGSDLVTNTIDRVRPTKLAATALLARVYLFQGKWELAEKKATESISNGTVSISNLDDVFKKNSSETIWALQPYFEAKPGAYNNAAEAALPWPGGVARGEVEMSNQLFNAFEPGDQRKSNWVKTVVIDNTPYYYPFKYKVVEATSSVIQAQEEYSIVLRLSEQYLIRAEARARLEKLTGAGSAKEDLDIIRARAGLNGTQASNKEDLLNAIWQERRVELFAECGGYRWMDLRRTGQIDKVMSEVTPLKGGKWSANKALLPIPYNEFTTNPALVGHQNPGYPERL